jgi:cytochrome c oxidase subunit 1
LYDGGANYAHTEDVLFLNVAMTHSAIALGIVQLPFIFNLFWSIWFGKKVESNPWDATTIEWAAPSPPIGHGNFAEPPAVYRGPYQYSEPGSPRDFTPQFEREAI